LQDFSTFSFQNQYLGGCVFVSDVLLVFVNRQLMENQIGTVERGAFDDMRELERL